MLRRVMVSTFAVLVASAMTAMADQKDDFTNAVKKLADSDSYSWTTSTQGGFGGGKTEGKTQKDGYTSVSMTMRDNTLEFLTKGDKAVVKTDDGWKTSAEILDNADQGGGGGFDPTVFAARFASNFKSPTDQAKEWTDKLANFQSADDGFSADLTPEAAKQMLMFRPRRAATQPDANAPQMDVSDAKASIKYWIKDGALSKIEIHVTGTVTFNGNDRDVDRTTTTEFKDVGSTTVTVPDDAKGKFGS